MVGFQTFKQGYQVSQNPVHGPKGDLAQNICALNDAASAEASATAAIE